MRPLTRPNDFAIPRESKLSVELRESLDFRPSVRVQDVKLVGEATMTPAATPITYPDSAQVACAHGAFDAPTRSNPSGFRSPLRDTVSCAMSDRQPGSIREWVEDQAKAVR